MKWSFLFPHLIPNPTRSFDHNWDFPKAFWKESRPLLIAAVLSLTAAEVARPFAVYHMESNTSLFMASPDDTTVRGDWKPSSIYQLYGRRSEPRRPKIIVHIYLKVVGLKERKAVYHAKERRHRGDPSLLRSRLLYHYAWCCPLQMGRNIFLAVFTIYIASF